MLKTLAISLLLGKTMAFSPSQMHAHKFFKQAVCRQFALQATQIPDRYIDLLGKSPYQEKIKDLFTNKELTINDNSVTHMYIDSPTDEWLPQFKAKKDKMLKSVSGDISNKHDFGNLLEDSVQHSLEVLSSQIEPNEHLPIRISIRLEKPKDQVLKVPQWHSDIVSYHLLINLLSDHCTLYHGPATAGSTFTGYYELPDDNLPKESVVEAPLGRYMFSSQGSMPVYHASPIKKHQGRVAIVLQVGPTPSLEDMNAESERGLRPEND